MTHKKNRHLIRLAHLLSILPIPLTPSTFLSSILPISPPHINLFHHIIHTNTNNSTTLLSNRCHTPHLRTIRVANHCNTTCFRILIFLLYSLLHSNPLFRYQSTLQLQLLLRPRLPPHLRYSSGLKVKIQQQQQQQPLQLPPLPQPPILTTARDLRSQYLTRQHSMARR